MTNHDLTQRLAGIFRRSPRQVNAPFECDAEIVRLGDVLWAATIDEFSAEEDDFTSDDPVQLGRNLAVATLSDLLAAGASPRFFLQALVLPHPVDPEFAEAVAHGLDDVVQQAGCFVLGGDLGHSRTWRFTGAAAGEITSGTPLTRSFAGASGALWATGWFGDANAAWLGRRQTPTFELRLALAKRMATCAVGVIDTSGGLLDALHTLAWVNPDSRIEVDLRAIPVADTAASVACEAGLPVEAALIGGAGEYELVFCLPDGVDEAVQADLHSLDARCIGRVRNAGPAGLFLSSDRVRWRLAPSCPDPRDFPDRTTYLQAVGMTACHMSRGEQ